MICYHTQWISFHLRSRVYKSLRAFSAAFDKRVKEHSCKKLDFHNDYDLDYICDAKNLQEIHENIQSRKGEGDVQVVQRLWQEYQNSEDAACKQELHDKFCKQLAKIPNKTAPGVPVGEEPRLIKQYDNVTTFPRHPKTLEQVAEYIGAGRHTNLKHLAGCSKPYYLTSTLCDLERALVRFTLTRLKEHGFKLISVPDIVSTGVVEACGFPIDIEDNRTVYRLTGDGEQQQCLSGTSEMALAAYFSNQQMRFDELPVKVCAVSTCHRPEIDHSGHEAGYYRVNHFTKVEMFSLTANEIGNESEEMLRHITDIQCSLYNDLKLNFKLLEMPSKELGASAYHKYDIESWMGGRGVYGEISSASNCTDYQSRRLGITYVAPTDGDGWKYVHTVNGTGCASPRMIISLVETHQRVHDMMLPQVLKPYWPHNTLRIGKPKMMVDMEWKKMIPSLRYVGINDVDEEDQEVDDDTTTV